jgi:prepilin-type processing-associated H-X9-DG protein
MKNGIYTSSKTHAGLLKMRLGVYRCPLDSVPDTNPFRGDCGTSNYVGNFGSTSIPRWSDSSTFWPGQTTSSVSGGRGAAPGNNGIFAMNSMVRIRTITDGTSNTLMVGERSVLGKAALWPGPRSNYQKSDVLADGSYASPINRSDTGYSSRHANGIVQFLMCDGSVRAIQEGIDSNDKTGRNMGVLQKLSARNDGNPVCQF